MARGPRRVGPSRVCGIKLSWSPATAHDDVLLALASCLQQRRKKLQQGQDRAHWRKRLPGDLVENRSADRGPRQTGSHRAPRWKHWASQSEESQTQQRFWEGSEPKSRWRRPESRSKQGCGPAEPIAYRHPAQGNGSCQLLKSLPETYRPECKSWCASNSSWNLSSALCDRMVQSPWREEDKWEKTGLRTVGTGWTENRKLSGAGRTASPGLPRSTVQTPSPSRTLLTHPQTLVNGLILKMGMSASVLHTLGQSQT